MLDPDQQVQESVRLLFQTFARTGSGAAPRSRYFRQQGLLFPTRVASGHAKGELSWVPLSLGRAAEALHNPWYAGAYVYGRGRWRKQPDGRMRHERLPKSEWHVLIQDAHPGYISWEEYERIEQRLQESTKALGWERRRARRGKVRPCCKVARSAGCAAAGCTSTIATAAAASSSPTTCASAAARASATRCARASSAPQIDAAVGELLVEAVTPMALELALAVQQEITARLDEADRLRHRAGRACTVRGRPRAAPLHAGRPGQPTRRRLARGRLERQAACPGRGPGRLPAPAHGRSPRRRRERASAHPRLATDFPAIWRDPNTPQRERKRMLGATHRGCHPHQAAPDHAPPCAFAAAPPRR